MTTNNPPENFLLAVLHTFEHVGIPYFIVGGFAAALHGNSRVTIDIDVVLELTESHIYQLVQQYPLPRYYVDAEQIRSSIEIGIQFNLIDTMTGDKVDLIPKSQKDEIAFHRRVRKLIDLGGSEDLEAWVASPEDTIIGKLHAWAISQSRKHEGDIAEMLVVAKRSQQPLDLLMITDAIKDLGVETIALWREIVRDVEDYT